MAECKNQSVQNKIIWMDNLISVIARWCIPRIDPIVLAKARQQPNQIQVYLFKTLTRGRDSTTPVCGLHHTIPWSPNWKQVLRELSLARQIGLAVYWLGEAVRFYIPRIPNIPLPGEWSTDSRACLQAKANFGPWSKITLLLRLGVAAWLVADWYL